MRAALKLFIDFIRKPEWVAALALLIQAVILWVQARILHKHGETMEEHAEIARAQSATAELIGKALEQPGKILAEQTKITQEQFRFQRRVEAQSARLMVYESLLEVYANIETWVEVGARNQRDVELEQRAWSSLIKSIPPCQKAVITSIHLVPAEKTYFKRYLQDIAGLIRSSPRDVPKFQDFRATYKDFSTMLTQVSQTPEE